MKQLKDMKKIFKVLLTVIGIILLLSPLIVMGIISAIQDQLTEYLVCIIVCCLFVALILLGIYILIKVFDNG